MNFSETGYDLVFRVDNVIDEADCDMIYNYMEQEKGKAKDDLDVEKMPWNEGDTTAYNRVSDSLVKEKIKEYKYKINDLISEAFDKQTYPHFSDLVLWRTGRKMWWHKDNGYEWDGDTMKPRKFSCVCYLNDNYKGGETLIKQGDEHYTSVPKKGSIVFFTSDERCEHRVTEVTEGTRLTLAIWYTTEKEHEEAS